HISDLLPFPTRSSSDLRKRILNITEKNDIHVVQWLTFLIEENNLDVSTLDSTLRRETVSRIKDSLHLGAEIGAKDIALVTGDNPDRKSRRLNSSHVSIS